MDFLLFHIGFLPVTFIDVLDIALVALILFKLYFIMHRTRAVQMFFGVIIIFVISFIAEALNMQETTWIFHNLRTVWIIAFVILFQPELRRVLTLIGQSKLVRFFTKEQGSHIVDEIVNGTVELTRRGYGALMVFARDTGLRTIIESGIQMDSIVSSSLIVSVFNPRSPLHDGAIVISNDVIKAAKCILPLTRNPAAEHRWGTRHRAALGISEETDAVVVVVSEETGKISIAENSEMRYDLTPEELQARLKQALRIEKASE